MRQTHNNAPSEAERRRVAIERTRGRLAPLAGGRSLVEEIIAERRAEARADAEARAVRTRARG